MPAEAFSNASLFSRFPFRSKISILTREALARESALKITAGGGVAALEDLRRLRALEPLGVDEVIVGKAFYEKCFTLGEAREALA